jgi:diaminopimelate epimerase
MHRNGFVKGHALGNDYIVVDPAVLTFPLTETAIRRICDRHQGVGSDGILVQVPSERADFGLRIFNPDGSEAEKSGNGLRIFARYLHDHGLATRPEFTVETPGGIARVTMPLARGRVDRITVDIGAATFRSDRIPAAGPPRDMVDESVDVNGQRLTVTAVSVGNPHCVVFVPDLGRVDLQRLGPQLERHPLFPNRTNVQFAQVQSRRRVAIMIWQQRVRGGGGRRAEGAGGSRTDD